MNSTNDSEPDAPKPRTSNRHAKRALAAASEYISWLLAASGLTVWGAMNLFVGLRTGFLPVANDGTSNAAEGIAAEAIGATDLWWLTAILVFVTGVVPFAFGLYLFRSLYKQTTVK